jgi:hypothetical protein
MNIDLLFRAHIVIRFEGNINVEVIKMKWNIGQEVSEP